MVQDVNPGDTRGALNEPAGSRLPSQRSYLIPLLAAFVGFVACYAWIQVTDKQVIGAVVQVEEVSSGLGLVARVDTGAAVSSIHCPVGAYEITDPSPEPEENVGKAIRLRLENQQGETARIDSRIEGRISVRNADHSEARYLMTLTLVCDGVRRTAHATLNDRAHMQQRVLLGRDFLKGAFVVDVTKDNPYPD